MKNKKQIFFLHFAGGSCFSYDFFNPHLAAYETHSLELPGRGKRSGEDFVNDIDEAAEDYTRQIIAKLNGAPFILFGHSMGAVIGAHVVAALEVQNHKPARVLFSGNAGPGVGEEKNRHLMNKDDFLAELEEIGGMPDAFFEHADLIDYFIPILKSDFKIIEEKKSKSLLPFETPIIALMGKEEKEVHNIDNWKQYTRSNFCSVTFDGGHFFIHQHVDRVVDILNKSFDPCLTLENV